MAEMAMVDIRKLGWKCQEQGWWTHDVHGGICAERDGWHWHQLGGGDIGPFPSLAAAVKHTMELFEETR